MGRSTRKRQPAAQPSSSPQRGPRTAVLLVVLALFAIALLWRQFLIPGQPRDSTEGGAGTTGTPSDAAQGDEVAAQLQRLDPRLDGWDTEVFQDAAGKQLKKVGHFLETHATENGDLAKVAADDFRCTPLRPVGLRQEFTDSRFTVWRPANALTGEESLKSLDQALTDLAGPLRRGDVHTKFKIISVEPDDAVVWTNAYYEAGSRDDRGAVQQSATWRCCWVPDKTVPRLRSIHVQEFEEVVESAAAARMFNDATAAVLNGNPSFQQHVMHGVDHWRRSLPKWTGQHYSGHHGLAIGDANGDGLDDLYVCYPGGLPNRLFVQNANGTATDVSAAANVDWLDFSVSALFLDLDNDGDQDLAVAVGWGVVLMSNDGTGKFELQAAVPLLEAMLSVTAADFDLDGDLDIYVCVNGGHDQSPIPYHDANNGGRNALIRNEGDWQFTDATEEVGLDENNRRFSFAASWEDYDRDGDPDLYVSNDYGRNNLFQNNNGHFRDVTAEAGVEDIAAGMSVDWADYNGDGWPDLYVSNMFSSAGNRVTYQRRFKSDVSEDLRSQFQRHARGNTLFENAGDGTFRDVSEVAGVTMGRWAWGSNFVDLNNDGRPDIFVANGYVTQEDTHDL